MAAVINIPSLSKKADIASIPTSGILSEVGKDSTELERFVSKLTLSLEPAKVQIGDQIAQLIQSHNETVADTAEEFARGYMEDMSAQIESASTQLLEVAGSLEHTFQATHIIHSRLGDLIKTDPAIAKAMKELDDSANLAKLIRGIVDEELAEAKDAERAHKDDKL